MKISFFVHSSIGIEAVQLNTLINPFITGNHNNQTINFDTIKADCIFNYTPQQDHILDDAPIATHTVAHLAIK